MISRRGVALLVTPGTFSPEFLMLRAACTVSQPGREL